MAGEKILVVDDDPGLLMLMRVPKSVILKPANTADYRLHRFC